MSCVGQRILVAAKAIDTPNDQYADILAIDDRQLWIRLRGNNQSKIISISEVVGWCLLANDKDSQVIHFTVDKTTGSS